MGSLHAQNKRDAFCVWVYGERGGMQCVCVCISERDIAGVCSCADTEDWDIFVCKKQGFLVLLFYFVCLF